MIRIQMKCSKKSVVIDGADLPAVAVHVWYEARRGTNTYAAANIDGVSVLMHRILMNPPDGLEVDHRDGDGLNNRRSNIRNVTRTINNHNRRGVKGYYLCRDTGRWRAQIEIGEKRKNLGRFDTEDSARAAYLSAKAELTGDSDV